MNKREIIERCIAAYSEAIQVCKSLSLDDALIWLESKYLDEGVCNYIINFLKVETRDQNWIHKYVMINRAYWVEPVFSSDDYPELIQSLQTRLDILKRELEIPE